MGQRRQYRGTVTSWDADNGYGEVDVPGLGPVWCHYSVIEAEPGTFRELSVGAQVVVSVYYRPDDEVSEAAGYRWIAEHLQRHDVVQEDQT